MAKFLVYTPPRVIDAEDHSKAVTIFARNVFKNAMIQVKPLEGERQDIFNATAEPELVFQIQQSIRVRT